MEDSLVNYGAPQLLSTRTAVKKVDKFTKVDYLALEKMGGEEGKSEECLNTLIPPREYEQNGQRWVRFASAAPGKSASVDILEKEMDKRLADRQARETGICPVRKELYQECFDELIRQITIDCAERGVLLVRVRDEFSSSIKSQQNLYESSIAYGLRKSLTAENKKTGLQTHIKDLEDTCEALALEIKNLLQKKEDIKQQDKKDKEKADRQHSEEEAKLEKDIKGWYSDLDDMLNSNPKQSMVEN